MHIEYCPEDKERGNPLPKANACIIYKTRTRDVLLDIGPQRANWLEPVHILSIVAMSTA